MHLIKAKGLKKKLTSKIFPSFSYLRVLGLHDKHTEGQDRDTILTGTEAKISGAMPPTSSSGLVSQFYNKSRKWAI